MTCAACPHQAIPQSAARWCPARRPERSSGHPHRLAMSRCQIRAWGRQAALGVQAMHGLEPPVAHRDVKPHNVLLEARPMHGRGDGEAEALAAQPLQARLLAGITKKNPELLERAEGPPSRTSHGNRRTIDPPVCMCACCLMLDGRAANFSCCQAADALRKPWRRGEQPAACTHEDFQCAIWLC